MVAGMRGVQTVHVSCKYLFRRAFRYVFGILFVLFFGGEGERGREGKIFLGNYLGQGIQH